uniref:Hypothetical conserved protein n=1 Tax=uncultured Chloroflexota bacterium TaxID=166587 RepID=H5SBF2_9CHLR|nr:hypothetical conserved protein [uncultured Chloroflexota bacterium]
MDPSQLAQILASLLPYLLKGGIELAKSAAGELGRRFSNEAWDGLKRLAENIQRKAASKPTLQEALTDAANAPTDEDALAALRLQLKKLLTEDSALATELNSIFQSREVHIYLHSAPSSAPDHPHPLHNLPNPDHLRFIGRKKELTWLRQRLSPKDRAWLLFITGIGGVGKSALAIHIAHEYRERYNDLPTEERFDAIIWASAKEQVLTPAGPAPAGPPGLLSRTIADIYRAIAQTLDREAITRAAPEDQDREVQKSLTAQRTLLILDNLDTMDEAVRTFLRNLPAPTKAIVTSREWLDVADVLRLYGMEQEDAFALMDTEAEAQGVTLTQEQKEHLYRRTEGLPLPIRLSIARLGSGETVDQVMRWLGNAAGDLPQYCVGGQVEFVRERNPDAYRLLLACSLFDREAGASREALGEIADLSHADRDDGLTLLWRLNLINRSQDDRFWMLPIVQEYAQSKLKGEEWGTVLVQRWLDWALDFAQKWAADLDIRIEKLPTVKAEYPNLRRALAWCEEHRRWETFIPLVENIWFYPYIIGLLTETKQMLTVAIDAAWSEKDERAAERLMRRQGILLWEQGEKTKAIEILEHGVSIARRYQDLREIALCLERLSDYLTELGNPEDALPLAKEVLTIANTIEDLQLKATAAYRLSMAESARGNLEASLEWLYQGEVWAKELGWKRALAWFPYRRGANLIQSGQPAEGERYLLQAIEMMTWDEPRLVAYAKTWLARAHLALGRLEEARRVNQEAIELVDRMGLHVLREDVESVLRQLPGEGK